MSRFGGIDLGGTKIEARLFDAEFKELGRRRIDTPTSSYEDLCEGVLDQARWLAGVGDDCPIGLGVPGVINPRTGMLLTANLPATGQTLQPDLEREFGRAIPCINDCRAFALSEALMGAGQAHSCVLGLVIGTGVAGGLIINGVPQPDLNNQHGEYGHMPLPAAAVVRHDLPILPCGCGKSGCFEALVAGPGLSQLAKIKTGHMADTHQIVSDPAFAGVVEIWIDLIAELFSMLARAIDPQVIVLGGGLGMIDGLQEDVSEAVLPKLLANTLPPVIAQAQGGGASGARGAALFAKAIEEGKHD